MNEKVILKGYFDGFQSQLEKTGFLGFLAQSFLAKKIVDEINDKNKKKELASGALPLNEQEKAVRQDAKVKDQLPTTTKKEQIKAKIEKQMPDEIRRKLQVSGKLAKIEEELAQGLL